MFGGGHLVLPLLHTSVVDPGWVTNDQVPAGYGAAQAVPGPLFTFSAYLGTVAGPAPNGVGGAVIALVAIFLPGILLIYGALPFWGWLRGSAQLRRALAGTNAAVVGIPLAALYTPIWTGAVSAPVDVGVAALGLAMLLEHTGDGIMAAFDDVPSALRCALAIQAGFQARSRDGLSPELRVRIGVAAGEPVDHNDDLFGSTVTLASRICGAAEAGCILTSDLVRDLGTERGFAFDGGRDVVLKGISGPTRVFELAPPGA